MRLNWAVLFRRFMLTHGVVVIILSIVGLIYALRVVHYIVPILLFFGSIIFIGVLEVFIALIYT